jgi:uncharacterized DUF497 family protein
MKIEYDPGKDAINRVKHLVSLADAALIEWQWALCIEDARSDYGESRTIAYAPIGSRVYCVVFTRRGEALRVISLRKANRREVRLYADKI